MSYTLRSGLTAGSVDHDEHGEFVISDGSLEVEDYGTAADLVGEFGTLFWADGDPQPVADEPEPDESVPEPDGDDGDADDGFDADAWLEDDYEDRAEAVESGEVDGKLDDIAEVERSTTVINAIEARQDELEG